VTRVVMWDFDGTLAHRPGRWSRCLAQSLAAVAAEAAVTEESLKPGLRDGFPWHRPDQPHDHLSDSDLWWAGLRPLLLASYAGAGVDRSIAERAASRVRDDYPDPRFWTVFDDTVPALTAARAAGWCNVIVSNHVPELPQLIKDLGLADHFTAVINSASAGWEKPNPELFHLALARSGHPEAVRMIGDNPIADIAGAEAVGIPGVLVRTVGPRGERALGLQDALDTFLS
jgi:putative hydrolase of the HAD superfamily